MNNEKIGKFIKQIREEKGLTQEELANMIPIGRQAVSKWERGNTTPDTQTLVLLSEIFNVSINEILAGEKNTTQNVILNLYEDKKKLLKTIKWIFILLVTLLLIFLGYYFFNQYNSIKIYTIFSASKDIEVRNGLFIMTKEKSFFNLGHITFLNEMSEVESVELYYLINNEEKVIYKSTSKNLNVAFFDYIGYEEYFDFDNINTILENFYVRIKFVDNYINLKLSFTEDYKNNNIFFTKDNKISLDSIKTNEISDDLNEFEIKLLRNFKNLDDGYFFEKELSENKRERYLYIPILHLLILDVYEGENKLESWEYFLESGTLKYQNNAAGDSLIYFKPIRCVVEKCSKNIDRPQEFLQKVYNLVS